jgi:hypothetical protein
VLITRNLEESFLTAAVSFFDFSIPQIIFLSHASVTSPATSLLLNN